MNRREAIGGIAAAGAVAAAGVGVVSVWRTDLNAKFVAMTNLAIEALKAEGMIAESGWVMVSDHRLQGDAIARRRYRTTLDSAGELDGTLLRNLQDGAVEIEGNWWVRGKDPSWHGLMVVFGFMAEKSAKAERGIIRYQMPQKRGALLSPDNDSAEAARLMATAIRERRDVFLGQQGIA